MGRLLFSPPAAWAATPNLTWHAVKSHDAAMSGAGCGSTRTRRCPSFALVPLALTTPLLALACGLCSYEGRWVREYVDATVPEMAFGEYWDTCSYSGELMRQGCEAVHRLSNRWVALAARWGASTASWEAIGRQGAPCPAQRIPSAATDNAPPSAHGLDPQPAPCQPPKSSLAVLRSDDVLACTQGAFTHCLLLLPNPSLPLSAPAHFGPQTVCWPTTRTRTASARWTGATPPAAPRPPLISRSRCCWEEGLWLLTLCIASCTARACCASARLAVYP